MVRPWALSAPIAVLLICLPLMRPLRHPSAATISDDEQARLATIQSLVEQHTFDIRASEFRETRSHLEMPDRHWYSDQSPTMAVLLSGPYWVMYRCGLTFARNPVLTEYLLTLLGVTLPVAFAAGLLYRMGRIFELKRPWRAGLALAVVLGSGWISYATVLSAPAAAAALVVMATACLVQATLTTRRVAALMWMTLSGACAALAATYDLTSLAFLLLLLLVILAFRWPIGARLAGSACYGLGALAPFLLYASLNKPISGDLRPGFLHPELHVQVVERRVDAKASGPRWLDDEDDPPSRWRVLLGGVGRFVSAFFGGHGLLTHFPVLVLGVIGVTMVMHRHWPTTTKVLAGLTMAAALGIILGYTLLETGWKDAMFANRRFLVFLPLTLFWAGAWLRRRHRPQSWAMVGVLLAFSTIVALLGATDPQPREGYEQYRYTAAGAWMHLVQPQQSKSAPEMLADQ